MKTLWPSGVNERISFRQWFTNGLVQLPESVFDILVNDVFARTKPAKFESRRLQQQQQPQTQQQQQSRVQQQQLLVQHQQSQQSDGGWQPPPSEWNPNPTPGVSVWNFMNTEYIQQSPPVIIASITQSADSFY
jgi:hypothetical protein